MFVNSVSLCSELNSFSNKACNLNQRWRSLVLKTHHWSWPFIYVDNRRCSVSTVIMWLPPFLPVCDFQWLSDIVRPLGWIARSLVLREPQWFWAIGPGAISVAAADGILGGYQSFMCTSMWTVWKCALIKVPTLFQKWNSWTFQGLIKDKITFYKHYQIVIWCIVNALFCDRISTPNYNIHHGKQRSPDQ